MVLVAMQKLVVSPTVVRRGWNQLFEEKAPKLLLSAYGMQFYFPGGVTWTQKPYILRNPPAFRIFNPTPAQIEARIALGRTAKSLQGQTGKASLRYSGKRMPAGTIVPKPAALIQEQLRGQHYSAYTRDRVRHNYHRGPHTLDDLMKMRAAPTPAPAGAGLLQMAGAGGT